MGHRLSKIYTRTGDRGTTGLADGSRLDKDDPRVEAMGDVDELNTCVGAVLLHDLSAPVRGRLIDVQHALFDIGGELAMPGASTVSAGDVEALERTLDELNSGLPPLKEFMLPGGGAAAISAHLARATCRRAERRLVTLARSGQVNEHSRRYLNRLSDLLFVLARVLESGEHGEVYWQPGRERG